MNTHTEETFYFLESQIKQTLAFLGYSKLHVPTNVMRKIQDTLKIMSDAQQELVNNSYEHRDNYGVQIKSQKYSF